MNGRTNVLCLSVFFDGVGLDLLWTQIDRLESIGLVCLRIVIHINLEIVDRYFSGHLLIPGFVDLVQTTDHFPLAGLQVLLVLFLLDAVLFLPGVLRCLMSVLVHLQLF